MKVINHSDFSVFVLTQNFAIFSAPCFAEKGSNCGLVGHPADSQCKSTLPFTYQGTSIAVSQFWSKFNSLWDQ